MTVGDEGPAWARRSISQITSTNTLPETTQQPTQADPSRAALEQLSRNGEPAPSPEWQPTTARSIAEFGEYQTVDEATVDERIEGMRVRLLFEESDQLVRSQQTDRAVDMLKAALAETRFDSSRFLIHRRLGAMAFREQNYTEAARQMKEALILQPNDPAMASNLAAAQMTLGDLEGALTTLQGIQLGLIQHRQLLFSVHFNLACLFSMKGLKDEALAHLVKAAESDTAAAFASLGDPQLDPLRDQLRFHEIRDLLESLMAAQ